MSLQNVFICSDYLLVVQEQKKLNQTITTINKQKQNILGVRHLDSCHCLGMSGPQPEGSKARSCNHRKSGGQYRLGPSDSEPPYGTHSMVAGIPQNQLPRKGARMKLCHFTTQSPKTQHCFYCVVGQSPHKLHPDPKGRSTKLPSVRGVSNDLRTFS